MGKYGAEVQGFIFLKIKRNILHFLKYKPLNLSIETPENKQAVSKYFAHNSYYVEQENTQSELKHKNKAAELGFTKISIPHTGLLKSPKFQDAFFRSLQQFF